MKNPTSYFYLKECVTFFSRWNRNSCSFVLLLTFLFLFNGVLALHAQNVTISLDVKNKSITEVLSIIEKKNNLFFTYDYNLFNPKRKISVSLKNKKIEEILKVVFKGENIGYKIKGKNVALYKIDSKVSKGQQRSAKRISGIIRDLSGVPIIGASIAVENGAGGTISDLNGKFSLNAHENDLLTISYIGFGKKELRVKKDYYEITLEEDANLVDEVVVVGYGTQKRGNLTGSIASLKTKEINTTVSSSLAQSLQGKMPGLQIRQQNGEPGTFNSMINIRGYGEPLYVIDGIVRDGSVEFQQLNPSDIESVSVLKDASAAVYGMNASNGVIVVTTKRGESHRPQFTYSGNVGWQKVTDRPLMANAAQYLEMYDDAIFYRDGVHSITNEELNKWRAGGPGYESTDWYNETMKKASLRHNHNLSIEGGNKIMKYFLSFSYYDEDGIFKSGDMGYDRYTFRSNVSAKLNRYLTTDVMVSGRYGMRDFPGGDGFIWMYKGTIISHPNERPYINDDPAYPANIYNQENPVVMSQKKHAGYTVDKNKSLQSAVSLTYDAPFLKGLQAKGTIAYDSYSVFNKNLWKSYRIYSSDLNYQLKNKPRIANNVEDADRIVLQAQVTFDRTFLDKHHVSALVAYEQKKYEKKHSYLKREYDFYTTDVMDYASGVQTNSGTEHEETTMAYIGKFNYDYMGKYLFEYACRYDGSYRYAPGKRWAFSPSLSAGWRISEESFIKDNFSFIDNLKIRGSYGVIGENVGEPFQHVMGFTPNVNIGYEFEDGKFLGTMAAPGVINRDFTWVRSEMYNVGVEFSVLRNKLNFELDFYKKHKSGKLKIREGNLPNTFGGSMPVENVESERTQGFDLTISHKNRINDFSYSASFNMNIARTMHRTVDKPAARSSYDRWKNGYTNRWNDLVWGFDKVGQFQNYEEILHGAIHCDNRGNTQLLPGDYIYDDYNGDGVINGYDTKPIFRNKTPKLFYGFTLNAQWKNMDLTMVFQGAGMYNIRFNEVFSQMFFNNGNLPAYFFDRWHLEDSYDPDNTNWVPGKWPANRFSQEMGSSYRDSQAWNMKASYLRLKSFEVGYILPRTFTKKYGVENLRLYFNAYNLFTFTDSFLKQFDPEKTEGDYGAGYNYPLTKSFNVGLSVSF